MISIPSRFLVLSLLLAVPAHAQSPLATQVAELLPTTQVMGHGFGYDVDIEGDTIIVGGPGNGGGVAYVFQRQGGLWAHDVDLLPAAPTPNGRFGESVAIDGDTIAVGATFGIAQGISTGTVTVFRRSPPGTWALEATLLPSDGAAGDRFSSIALDGDFIAVGAARHDASAADSGAVYAFRRQGASWIQSAKLEAANPFAGQRFGRRLAMSDPYLVTEGGEMFGRWANFWLRGPDLDFDSWSPISVAMDGTSVARGGFSISGVSGAALLEPLGLDWVERTRFQAANNSNGIEFGSAIDLIPGLVAIGAQQVASVGAVYLSRFEAGQWDENPQPILSPDASGQDLFGSALAMDGDVLVVGAPNHDHGPGFANGSVYVYDLSRTLELPEGFCRGGGETSPGCTPCPCDNDADSFVGGGCSNSIGLSAVLRRSGVPSMSADSLQFDLEGATVLSFALLLSADNALPVAGACAPGSGITTGPPLDGLRCVGGALVRHGARPTSFTGRSLGAWGGAGNQPTGGLIAQGAFLAGQERHWQVFYRDLATESCGYGVNSSQALSTTFTP